LFVINSIDCKTLHYYIISLSHNYKPCSLEVWILFESRNDISSFVGYFFAIQTCGSSNMNFCPERNTDFPFAYVYISVNKSEKCSDCSSSQEDQDKLQKN